VASAGIGTKKRKRRMKTTTLTMEKVAKTATKYKETTVRGAEQAVADMLRTAGRRLRHH
jgi:hypothetical protein